MTQVDAEKVLLFVRALPAIVHSLVVQREGGFARSAGVVLALKALYGYEVEDARLVPANQSGVQTLVGMVDDRREKAVLIVAMASDRKPQSTVVLWRCALVAGRTAPWQFV